MVEVLGRLPVDGGASTLEDEECSSSTLREVVSGHEHRRASGLLRFFLFCFFTRLFVQGWQWNRNRGLADARQMFYH